MYTNTDTCLPSFVFELSDYSVVVYRSTSIYVEGRYPPPTTVTPSPHPDSSCRQRRLNPPEPCRSLSERHLGTSLASQKPHFGHQHTHFTPSSSICLVCDTDIVEMEVIKGLFGKAQEVAEVVVPQKKDDGYSRDVSTCPGTSSTLLGARADF